MRIPDASGFGEVVSDPVRLDRRQTTADAFGAGIGLAVQNIGMDMLAEQRREQREAEATRDAADRATAVRTVHAARDSLAAAHDEVAELVRTGELPKEEAATRWQERSREISETMTAGVPAKYLPDTQADIESQNARYTRGIQKAITQRDQSDVRAGLDSAKEVAQRLYMKDPAAAQAMLDGAYETMGPHSGLAPDVLAKDRQSWMENTRFTKAGGMILAAQRDNKALTEVEKALQGDEFAPLDTQKRLQLQTHIESAKVMNAQRAEVEARRIEAAREKALREADSALNDAAGMLMAGQSLTPDFVDFTIKKTAQNPAALETFRHLMKQQEEGQAFGVKPLAVMDAAIAHAKLQPTNKAREKQIDMLERIRNEAKQGYEKNPLQEAQRRGGPPVTPLNFSSPEGFVSSIAGRLDAVAYAEGQVRKPVSPLQPDEAVALTDMMKAMPTKAKEDILGVMQKQLGPRMIPLLKDMKQSAPTLAVAGGLYGMKTTEGRSITRLIIEGDALIANKEFNVPSDGKMLEAFTKQVGEAIPTSEGRRAAMEAATAVYAKLMAERGAVNAKDVSSVEWRSAVSQVTGGVMDYNGKKILRTSFGATEADSRKLLKSISPAQVKAWGGVAGMTDEQAAEYIRSAPLDSVANGRYRVMAGGSILQKPDGSIFEVVFP